MDPVLLIGLDIGLDLNLIQILVNELLEPRNHNLLITERGIRSRNENYVEAIVPLYSDNLFKDHFRMSRISFEILINTIGNNMLIGQNTPIDLNKKIMFSVWVLAKPESFLSVGDRFGIAKSTGHMIFRQITDVLTNLLPEYVKWPAPETYNEISHVFETRSRGFPGVVGAIDGCHIQCKQPVHNANDYYNRKGSHSIILQGVCDDKLRFIDVFIGLPGRMHDARVFRNSQLYSDMTNNRNPLLPPRYHILGDSAYPLLKNIMTPWKDNGHLTQSQIAYNTKLCSIRSVVERAFCHLKGRFRRLKYLDISDFVLGNKMIASCCVLHNFIINENETDDLEINEDPENVDVGNEEVQNEENLYHNINQDAINKRNNIVLLF